MKTVVSYRTCHANSFVSLIKIMALACLFQVFMPRRLRTNLLKEALFFCKEWKDEYCEGLSSVQDRRMSSGAGKGILREIEREASPAFLFPGDTERGAAGNKERRSCGCWGLVVG